MPDLVAVDFLVEPMIRFRTLFVFVVLNYDRKAVTDLNVKTNPIVNGLPNKILKLCCAMRSSRLTSKKFTLS